MWQVLGQASVLKLMECSLEMGRLSHAYLLVGPQGIGKMTLALNLAQVVNCEAPEEGNKARKEPCGQCSQCQRIASGKHPDVQVLGLASGEGGEGKSKISIERIRELQQAASLSAFEGKYRVFIIDGAEHLSLEAANCLLKTLEEPPPNVLLILLTVDDELLLPTLRSRCQRIELRPMPIEKVAETLISRWEVERGKAQTLAHLSQGCLGRALTLHTDEEALQRRMEKLDELTGLAEAPLETRFAYAKELASLFPKSRGAVQDVLSLWLSWWRDLLLTKGDVVEYVTNLDFRELLSIHAERYSFQQIKGFIGDLRSTREGLEQNVNPRLALEVLMLSLPKLVD